MGSFFTNVQVRADDDGRRALIEALRAGMRAEGWSEVEDDASADRTLVVRDVDEGGWVAVYDSATEAQDQRELDALAELVSTATGDFALTTLVHDSDILAVSLFEAGELADRFDSFPEYFEPRGEAELRAVAGDASQWTSLLVEGVAPGDLAALFERDDLFAERTLHELAKLLGIDAARAAVGYRYLDEARDDPANLVLRLRSAARPAWERELEGPPSLQATSGHVTPLVLAAGDPVRTALSTLNRGGATRGVRIAIWGEALERGHVTIDSVELVLGDVRADASRTTYPLEDAQDAQGRIMRVVAVPDALVPAGAPTVAFGPGMDLEAFMSSQQRARLHINVIGRATSAGEGALHAGVVCVAHPDAQTSASHAVRVDAPLWAPLRVAPPQPMVPRSQMLRPLSRTGAHVALAVLREASREQLAAVALAAFAQVIEARAFEGEFDLAVFHSDAQRRPTSERLDALDLADLQGRLEQSRLMKIHTAAPTRDGFDLDAHLRRAAEGGGVQEGAGWMFGGRLIAQPDAAEALVIAAWVGADGRGAETLARLLETLADAGQLVQATWSPAGWVPMDIASTRYEDACGVRRLGTDPAWCERWLRWPGRRRVFLNPKMIERLDAPAVEAVATQRDGEHGTWLERRPDASRDAWEAALAPLLPSADDARSFLGR